MANKIKEGLDYFPFDVDFFDDDKIELISSEFGIKGEIIAIRLLCMIYRNGYYYEWGKDKALLLAKRVGDGVTSGVVSEIVTGLVRRSFFDKGVYDRFSILTSKAIQRRYFGGAKRRQDVSVLSDIILIDLSDFKNVNINKIDVNINDENVYINSQSKVKESKVKESKRKESIVFARDHDFENSVLKFFGFSELNYDKARMLHLCCFELKNTGRYEVFVDQVGNYCRYKEINCEWKHSFANFIGTLEAKFEDGAWNAENWAFKLKEAENKKEKDGTTGKNRTTHQPVSREPAKNLTTYGEL